MSFLFALFFFVIAIINVVLAVLSWQEKLSQIKGSNRFYALPEEKKDQRFKIKAKVNTGLYFLVADFCILLGIYQIYKHEVLKLAITMMVAMMVIYYIVTLIYLKKKV